MSADFPSEFANNVFADSEISEAEYAEARRIIENCFAASELSADWDAFGRLVVEAEPGAAEPPQAMSECSFADGGVVVLYEEIRLNPRNEDELQIRAQCLTQAGVVGHEFDAQQLQGAYEREEFPWTPGDAVAERCLLDPLGIVDQGTALPETDAPERN